MKYFHDVTIIYIRVADEPIFLQSRSNVSRDFNVSRGNTWTMTTTAICSSSVKTFNFELVPFL